MEVILCFILVVSGKGCFSKSEGWGCVVMVMVLLFFLKYYIEFISFVLEESINSVFDL